MLRSFRLISLNRCLLQILLILTPDVVLPSKEFAYTVPPRLVENIVRFLSANTGEVPNKLHDEA